MFRRLITLVTLISISSVFPGQFVPISNSASGSIAGTRKQSSCPTCAGSPQAQTHAGRLDRLGALGRSTQAKAFTPLSRSIFEGTQANLVSTATGALSFAITDLSVPGRLPLVFQRSYASDRTSDFGLGVGWSFTFDDRIQLNGDTAQLTTGTGSILLLQRNGQTQHFVLKRAEPGLHQSFDVADANTIRESAAGMTRTYRKFGDTYRLTEITDPNGHATSIDIDAAGNVTKIANAHASISLQWSSERNARLLSITDSTGRRISYKQDGQRLRVFTDAANQQWKYDYEHGQLTRASDPQDRTLLGVRYDLAGRVLETGDASGTSLYSYDSNSNAISRRTTVTDPGGAKITYTHTEEGVLLSATTDEGGSLNIVRNAMNRPTVISTSSGDETRFEYDTQNRLVGQSSADGTQITNTYDDQGRLVSTTNNGERTDYTLDARGNVIAAKSSDPAKSYTTTTDADGRSITISSAAGRQVALEYDAAGNPSATTYSDRGRFEIKRNAAGRISSVQLPTGLSYTFEYDARGRITKKGDSKGHSLSIERDASGAPSGFVAANGHWIRATRDNAGRVTTVTSSNGKSRNFVYDARGALTSYTDARGHKYKLNYDDHGRLGDITYGDGTKVVMKRDEKGRPSGITVTRGQSARAEYDANGKLISAKHGSDAASFIPASYSHAISAFTSSAVASQDFWGVDFDPYGDMFFFDGFWTGGSDFYGSACDAGFGFDDFWGGSFDFWGYNDPYGGFDLFDPWGSDYGFDMWDGGWYGGGGDVFNDWILEDDAEMEMMMTTQNSHQGGPDSSSQEGRTARFTRASYTPSVRLLPMLQNSCSTGPTGPGSAACSSCMLYKRTACDSQWQADYAQALGVDLVATGACAALTAGVGAVFCAIGAGAAGIAQVYAANRKYDACILTGMDQCPSCH